MRLALWRRKIAAPFGEIGAIDKHAFRLRTPPLRIIPHELQELRIGAGGLVQPEGANLDGADFRIGLAVARAEFEKRQKISSGQPGQSGIVFRPGPRQWRR
jgi:hypothetical protein